MKLKKLGHFGKGVIKFLKITLIGIMEGVDENSTTGRGFF